MQKKHLIVVTQVLVRNQAYQLINHLVIDFSNKKLRMKSASSENDDESGEQFVPNSPEEGNQAQGEDDGTDKNDEDNDENNDEANNRNNQVSTKLMRWSQKTDVKPDDEERIRLIEQLEQLNIRVEELERKQEKDDLTIKQLQLLIIEQNEKVAELHKFISKQHYESKYPAPSFLRDHKKQNPKSFYIQYLGGRGAGKSTLFNKTVRKMGYSREKVCAATGPVETSRKTQFFEITDKIENIPEPWKKVFLADQPGIGGMKVKEDQYLTRYGPGLREVMSNYL